VKRQSFLARGLPHIGLLGVALLALSACGGGSGGVGGGGTNVTPVTYTIGGTISGLSAGGLVLANGSQTASPAANAASFTFPTAESSGASYAISVSSQPSGQTCTVVNGSGTVATANVSVQVSCATNNMGGTAATGSAIAGASVTLVDSNGTQVTTKTDSTGTFSLSSTGLTPPFLVKVVTASASTNGYTAGTTFYSVSDQANPSVINITPLTDLIIRNWYAVQGTPVSLDTAFANPKANPPPSVSEIRLIQAVVLDMVQPVLQQSGVNPVGLDLISGSFSANGQGVDAALDQIKPITYNSAGSTATVTIDTTSTTTQTSTVTASAGSTQIATSTSDSSSGATSSIVTSAIVPTSAAESAALVGAQATLSNLGSLINSKGSALQGSDVAAYIDTGFLDGGRTGGQQALDIASSMAGATITSLNVSRITSFDSTNNLIGIVGTVNYTAGGISGSSSLGSGTSDGLIFKQESNGSWLMYGDQQEARSDAYIESVMNNNPDGTTWSGPVLWLQVQAPATSATTPCTSSYVSSATVYPATAITATDQNTNTPVTLAPSGYALAEDSVIYQSQGANICQFDGVLNSLLFLPSSSLANVVGDQIGFALNAAAQVPALIRTIPGYTTETINFTNLSGHALSAVQLGQAMTLTWTLPVTFPIANVEVYGMAYASNGSSYVSCAFKPTTPLAITSTSVTLTPPTTCNGSPIASIPQPGPSAIQINVSVTGTHGEVASAWWPLN
jgi:hypothetical protein